MAEIDRRTALRAVAALDDPSRRALYELVRSADQPVTRETAAAAVGISRKLAAFHLDKLVEVGLLVADYEQSARTKQFGRPPKAYRRSAGELRISIPERQPETLARLLIEGLTGAREGEPPLAAVLRVAHEAGRRLGAESRRVIRPGRLGPERAVSVVARVLATLGFEPDRESETCVRLRNCPYLPLSEQATELVCGINHHHITGLLQGLEAPRSVSAVLAPRSGRCCVELRVG